MTSQDTIKPTKTHRGENFPVASHLIERRHRGPILAFYSFVRAADDIADHPSLKEAEKLARLKQLEDTLLGRDDAATVALPLRRALTERGLDPRHAQDLLAAFRMDVTKHRYTDWNDLIGYCTLSAMPVGRFVLDVHGENRATWQASDALCAALQIINHLQDCRADYQNLDRVYVPLDTLDRHGLGVEALGADKASPALRQCLHELAENTEKLLHEADALASRVRNMRLGLEIAVIHKLALALVRRLKQRDPLSERVHLHAGEVATLSLVGAVTGLLKRNRRTVTASARNAENRQASE